MAKNVVIREVVYANTPYVDIPIQNSQEDARFYDTSTSTTTSTADVRNGKKYFDADGEKTGTMAEKAAATYKPSTSAQTIAASQYLAGAQTIEAVVTSGISASNIVEGAVVKVGTTSDDDSIISVTGAAQIPSIVQDSTTHGLRIS